MDSSDAASQQPTLQTLVPPGHETHPPFVATHAEHASSIHGPNYPGAASTRAERPPSLLPVLHHSLRGAMVAHKEAEECKQAVKSLQTTRADIKRVSLAHVCSDNCATPILNPLTLFPLAGIHPLRTLICGK